MKKVILQSNKLSWILSILIVLGFASCKKESSSLVGGTGAPTITSVRTVAKSAVDSSLTKTVTTYDASGVATSVTTANYTPQITKFDSTTATGSLGNTYAAIGNNLGSTTKILLNGVSIYFNPALNSNTSVIFTIPSTIPTVNQSNTLQIVTLHGSFTYSFTTLTPPPTVTGVSDYDFWAGSTITLTGVSFSSVSAVGLKGGTETAAIASKTDTTMVLTMPASTVANRAQLVFTYVSGGTTSAQATSTQEFINLDNAYTIFYKNSFQNGWGDGSWQSPSGVSTGASHSGTSSIVATYPSNGWKIEGWANWWPGFAYSSDYKYLTFWVKGGTVATTLTLVGDKMAGGYSQNTSPTTVQQITVPATVWTFFKIPLGAPSSTSATLLNYWANGTTANQLGFFLKGASTDVDQTIYFDEVAFVK